MRLARVVRTIVLFIAIAPIVQGIPSVVLAQSAQAHPSQQAARLPRNYPGGADLPNGWKGGQQINLRGASFFELRDGLIGALTDIS